MLNAYVSNHTENLIRSYRTYLLDEKLHPAHQAKLETFTALVQSLTGHLSPGLHLAAMDCGQGKSRLIQQFLQLWKRHGFLPYGGVLICLSRLEEIDIFVQRSGLDAFDYAVVTGDRARNRHGRGRADAGNAPVIFTTQQKLEAELSTVDRFADLADYHYRGVPRRCKIWDESLVPEEMVLGLDHIAAIPAAIRDAHPVLAQAVFDLCADARHAAATSANLIMPDWLAERLRSECPFGNLDRYALSSESKEALTALARMGGSNMGVGFGYKGQLSLVSVKPYLPADFFPAIVFDASGRVRPAYNGNVHGVPVRRLPPIVNHYSQLTIRHWKTAFGKDTRRHPAKRGEVLAHSADLIRQHPAEEWLVIHHKAKPGSYDIAAELRANLPGGVNVRFLTWGLHHSTNQFRTVKKVLILGMHRKPEHAYTALSMAIGGKPYDAVGSDEVDAVRVGEHSHDILQAVCRANVRNVEDGVAGETEVYLVMSGNEWREVIPATFPGCRFETWVPALPKLTGHIADFDVLITALAADLAVSLVPKKTVRLRLGLGSSHALSNLLRDPRSKATLARFGVIVEPRSFRFDRAA